MPELTSPLNTPKLSPQSPSPSRISLIGLAGYVALIAFGVGAFFLVQKLGNGLHAPPPPADAQSLGKPGAGQIDVLLHVTATLAAVVALGAVLSRILRYFGQPPVIGEVLAGIMLGPSLLGAFSPETMQLLIPSVTSDPHARVPAAIKAISQLGVIIYMFLVGLELNGSRIAARMHSAVAVSHASIVLPFTLAAALALALYPLFSNAAIPFTSFALFIGISMSITAFPVLARILTDRNLDKTEIGAIALGCAAADDVSAWCLLALVVGVTQANMTSTLAVIGGAALFVLFVFYVVQPLAKRATQMWDRTPGALPPTVIAATFVAVLLASMATEAIGVHALFGSFLLGSVIPHDSKLARDFSDKLKGIVTVLLLPAFFAYTGMRMQIGLISGLENWIWCGVIILVATIGKFGGTLGAAKLTGLSWRDSAILGTLMNTRGLVELIVLNIGLDLGVISAQLFAMMVIMALVTTAFTAPVLEWLIPEKQITQPSVEITPSLSN